MTSALDINALVKTYSNGVHALQGINLCVESGQFIGLLGPNGAGKSTIIGIINSLIRKTSGIARIYGYEIDKNPSEAKSFLGVVPQEFNFGIFEKVKNVLIHQAGYYGIPKSIARVRAEKYLALLDLLDKKDEVIRNLSGGMKRRLMIARALMHEPRLLILDEPTAGVDVEVRRLMWQFLKKLNSEGVTIILTTHYLEEAENLCDHIAIINHGKIIQNTSKKQLLSLLNVETIILDIAKPLEKALASFDGFHIRTIDSTTLEVEFSKTHELNQLFSYLSSQQVVVKSLRNQTNRLEELFLRLTA